LRDNVSGQIHCLVPEIPASSSVTGCNFVYAGSSLDGSRAFFASGAAYAGAPTGPGFSLYEWSEAKGLQLLSVLTNGTPATPLGSTTFGPRGEVSSVSNCQTGQSILRHAISADGSHAIWTYAPTGQPSQLLDRINGTETIQLDALPAKKENPGPGPSGNGIYWAASTDGSVVYFTSQNRLTSGSKSAPGEEDLYRYDFNSPTIHLVNLTKNSLLVPGDVKGVVGASDDGAYVYFVAGAVLTGEEQNEAGLEAQAGKDNLYVWNAGQTRFIATLAPEDAEDWGVQPAGQSARVVADGRHLAFLSVDAEDLAGFENKIAQGEHCQYEPLFKKLVGSPLCAQAFLYDAESGHLTCASCNPSGSRPTGPTLLPGWTNVYEGPRLLSDDGSRLFFESMDRLLQSDESAKRDVYEFELPGTGSCSASSPNFDPTSGGCHFLLSGGRSPDETYLVDASADGRDVFFSTRAQLVGWADGNQNYDIYDYRVGGGFPEPPPAPDCTGEGSCLAPPPPEPSRSSRATPNFTGPANSKPKPKPKKHHKKKQTKKHKKKGKGSKQQHKKGRANR